jgi:hypothetical protein
MKYCGSISSFMQMRGGGEMLSGDMGAFLDPDGELVTTIYVAKIKLNSNEKLDLEIVYTSYRGTFQIQVN